MRGRALIAGGGTGGHIFPGLAVVAELEAMGVACHWLGARRGLEAELVGKRGIPITLVELEGVHARGLAAATRAAAQLPAAISTAITTLLRLKPRVVLGVGGYASSAGVLAAGALGIPWVLQEQNAVPGWTNRFLAPWADAICCGFADAVGHFPSLPAEWTGNPVRREFFTTGPVRGSRPPRVVVLGGSQGSLFLNRTLPQALSQLREMGLVAAVRHQAGVRWTEVVRTSYQDVHLEAEVSAFLSEPWQALADADLVVARAGALTIAELAAAGRGALLVPFAAAAGNHQEHNARSLEHCGGAVVMTEAEATPSTVAQTLARLLGDPGRLAAMGEASRSAALPDAAQRIARRLLSTGGGP
jgi:UDP-N-acetylglucosamine--N-acetylmuramyl-(pentapeptide) pyrophosphoryl-undecaprenol N-acetylglucosamine transferase